MAFNNGSDQINLVRVCHLVDDKVGKSYPLRKQFMNEDSELQMSCVKQNTMHTNPMKRLNTASWDQSCQGKYNAVKHSTEPHFTQVGRDRAKSGPTTRAPPWLEHHSGSQHKTPVLCCSTRIHTHYPKGVRKLRVCLRATDLHT